MACHSRIIGSWSSPSILKPWIKLSLTIKSDQLYMALYGLLGLPLWLSWLRIRLQCGIPRFDLWVGKIPWRRKRLPTLVFWPGEFHGLYSPWGHKELDTSEQLSLHFTPLHFNSLRFTLLQHAGRLGWQSAHSSWPPTSQKLVIFPFGPYSLTHFPSLPSLPRLTNLLILGHEFILG